jgi:hypothetical protein
MKANATVSNTCYAHKRLIAQGFTCKTTLIVSWYIFAAIQLKSVVKTAVCSVLQFFFAAMEDKNRYWVWQDEKCILQGLSCISGANVYRYKKYSYIGVGTSFNHRVDF